ncbi:MAG: NUDIX domain-containing protein, partial [Patescibacteria group bacterium]
MKIIVEKLTWGGKDYELEWIPNDGTDLVQYTPITQAYGVCITSENTAVIVTEDEGSNWTLPGGSVEPGETLEQTLVREVDEEADITIKDIRLLGLQKSTSEGKTIY